METTVSTKYVTFSFDRVSMKYHKVDFVLTVNNDKFYRKISKYVKYVGSNMNIYTDRLDFAFKIMRSFKHLLPIEWDYTPDWKRRKEILFRKF